MNEAGDQPTESTLRADLERSAGYAVPSPPPVADLIRAGDARARLTRARWAVACVAAAAVALAVTVPTWLGGRYDTPQPSEPITTRSDDGSSVRTPLPYLRGGLLHIGDEGYAVQGHIAAAAGGTVVIVPESDLHGRPFTIRTEDFVAVGAGTGVAAGVSPAGRYVWWHNENQDHTRTTVTIWSAAEGRVIATKALPGSVSGQTGGGGDLAIIGVDDEGRLLWTESGYDNNRTFLWQAPAGSEVSLHDLDDAAPVVLTPVGIQARGTILSSRYEDDGPEGPYLAGRVADEGSVEWTGRLPDRSLLAPGGRYAVYGVPATKSDPGSLHVVTVGDVPVDVPEPLDFELPEGVDAVRPVWWEDADTVLLASEVPHHTTVLRCEVPAMTCAVEHEFEGSVELPFVWEVR